MAISISNVFKTVASEKYNKKNILIFFVIALILMFGYCYIDQTKSKTLALASIVLWLIFTVFTSGYYAMTVNNDVNNKESIFPSINEILNISKYGIVFFLGYILISIILYLIPFIALYIGFTIEFVALLGSAINFMIIGLVIVCIACISICIIGYFYLYPIIIRYLSTFDFKDFFNFKQAIAFRRERKGLYRAFFWKSILLYFLFWIVSCVIATLIYFISKNYVSTLTDFSSKAFMSTVACCISIMLMNLYIPNLISQLVNQTNENTEE